MQTVVMREWSKIDANTEPALRGRRLSVREAKMLAQLSARTSLRVEELRQGLSVRVGSHVGVVPLDGLQILILPKLAVGSLMRVIAYSVGLGALVQDTKTDAALSPEQTPGADFLMGLAALYLHEVERVFRKGLVPSYVEESDTLVSIRGRVDLRRWQSQTPVARLRGVQCSFQSLSKDNAVNQALVAGLRWLAQKLGHNPLATKMRRVANALLDSPPRALTKQLLAQALADLSRLSAHYRPALQLLAILFQNDAALSPSLAAGDVAVGAFLLDMNLIFERFLARCLAEHAPPGLSIQSQQSLRDVFTYLHNPAGWQQPKIRPDFIITRDAQPHPTPIAIADAKYRDRTEHPPSTQELYQLTTYGLSLDLPPPRTVLLLHPLGDSDPNTPPNIAHPKPSTIHFNPPQQPQSAVEIRLVGVPLSALANGELPHWWPLDSSPQDPHRP
jgi:5-methylcytosine-specific restriction enzyme subunit McrC